MPTINNFNIKKSDGTYETFSLPSSSSADIIDTNTSSRTALYTVGWFNGDVEDQYERANEYDYLYYNGSSLTELMETILTDLAITNYGYIKGGKIVFAKGDYNTVEEVDLKNLDGLVIEGEGPSTIFSFNGSQCFKNLGKNLIFKNICFKHNVKKSLFNCVGTNRKVIFDNCYFEIGYNGIGITCENASEVTIKNCYFYNAFTAEKLQSPQGIMINNSNKIIITNNHMILGKRCIDINTNSFNNIITNNVFESKTDFCIVTDGTEGDNIISNNIMLNNSSVTTA